MLVGVALVAGGFVAGVVLTGLVAVYVFGQLHAEAVQALEGHGGLWLFTSQASPRGVAARDGRV
jgi:hypothetical protein